QIIPPHDAGIAAAIATIGRTDQLPMPELDELRRDGLLVDLDESVHDAYLDRVCALRACPDVDGRALVIAYTPMHGVGTRSVEPAMQRAGFPQLHIEPSQREPD